MSNVKIVIVDDSSFQIAVLKNVLIESGFEVVGTASCKEELIEVLSNTKPNIVTMDVTMPGADGFECTKVVHEIDKNIKVIMVSSMMDEEVMNKAKKYGVSGYVQKPIDAEELSLLINRVNEDYGIFNDLSLQIYDTFKEATSQVFNKLIKKVPEINSLERLAIKTTSEGILVIMGIVGKYSGRVIFDMTFDTSKYLTKLLLNKEDITNEDAFNVAGELTNMIAGNACSMLNRHNKILGLRVAPPTIFHGNSIDVSTKNLDEEQSMNIETKFGDIKISIGFNRGESSWMSNI